MTCAMKVRSFKDGDVELDTTRGKLPIRMNQEQLKDLIMHLEEFVK